MKEKSLVIQDQNCEDVEQYDEETLGVNELVGNISCHSEHSENVQTCDESEGTATGIDNYRV